MPKISIIIPVFKVEKYLRRCLDSVLNQTFDDWQAICVNDCSPDNSQKILDEYAVRDKRFVLLKHDKNSGLSASRNTAISVATGDYIMYLDSDDFIHPQTMEIAYALAMRDKSDIVAYTYDRHYRPQLMARKKMGFDIDNAMPRGIAKKYKLNRIKSHFTTDIFAHVTERTHNKIKWPIKHCQVWKFLIRRDFLNGLDFIPGIIYEDLPWWSAVLLRHPRTTITNLEMYYYFPNFSTSILLSYQALHKLSDRNRGIIEAFKLYKENATTREMDIWQREFMWQFIIHSFREVGGLNDEDKEKVKPQFIEMDKIGMLDNPPFKRATKYQGRIREFIK